MTMTNQLPVWCQRNRRARARPSNRERLIKIKRVEHVAIAVHDMAESKAMLEEIFGFEAELEERIDSTRLAMYPVGETYIELLETEEPGSWIDRWL